MLTYENRPNEDVLDDVYQKYVDSDPFMPITHFIDHSTMGAEALVELGLGDKVAEWIANHRARPYQAPRSDIAIATDWQQALGHRECHGDFIKHFEEELSTQDFPQVLNEWVPRFAHEVGAFLFHGLIRTAHATRALTRKNTSARRSELARGLALWAIGVKSIPPERVPEDSASAVPGIDIMHYARFGAAAFVSDPNVPKLHLVTGPMAYMLLAPHLDAQTHTLARAGFEKTHHQVAQQFEAVKHKAYAASNVVLDNERLQALALQSDAHPIKLTEAAMRAHQESRDDIFLKAADKALAIHSLRALLGVAKAMVMQRVA